MAAFYTIVIGLLFAIGSAQSEDCWDGSFQCPDGTCIPEYYVCNGENDCGDLSDEPADCGPCPRQFWQCANGNCIRDVYICDGDNDCGDMSDELDPETGTCPICPDRVYQCGNGQCIDKYYVCNGDIDCADSSDETESACPCSDDEFRCPTPPELTPPPGACIPPEYICDAEGVWDCPDGSDEANCTVASGNHLKRDRLQKGRIPSVNHHLPNQNKKYHKHKKTSSKTSSFKIGRQSGKNKFGFKMPSK